MNICSRAVCVVPGEAGGCAGGGAGAAVRGAALHHPAHRHPHRLLLRVLHHRQCSPGECCQLPTTNIIQCFFYPL